VGGGVIGLSLALSLRRHGAKVLIIDRGAPGREASYAAGGMLSDRGPELLDQLRPLAVASALRYPEFVHELQDESRQRIDLREDGTLLFSHDRVADAAASMLDPESVKQLEPQLEPPSPALLLQERSVDPRQIIDALLTAAKHRGIEIATGNAVDELLVEREQVVGVRTRTTTFRAAVVVNCAGAWAGAIGPAKFPVKPIKGQMLALVAEPRTIPRHVIRTADVYLIPRNDGRLIVGSTLEDAGFDKRVDAPVIQALHQKAAALVPELGEARMLEAWTGLRPATPDELPILGRTRLDGYFVATGHYRDGILLAPITALLMTQLIRGQQPGLDITAFSPGRFFS